MQSHPSQDKLLFAVFLEGCVSFVWFEVCVCVVRTASQHPQVCVCAAEYRRYDVQPTNPHSLTSAWKKLYFIILTQDFISFHFQCEINMV